MKLSSFAYFAAFGIRAILSGSHKPILGTVILTDKCNLTCRHCSVNNITGVIYPYTQIKTEMQQLYEMGVRILFFCGGETFMWRDGGKTLCDLVKEAKAMGFFIVNVVTNGTFPIDLPEADLILLSLDGDREHHNIIRGDTYDTITKNVENATSDNICFYMAINRINKECIRSVCETATGLKNVRKDKCCKTIAELKRNGAPIFNLTNAFPYIVDNSFPTPCRQCVVIENGKLSVCGRCIDVPELCSKCGYFFVAEYTLLFRGNLKIIIEMLRTYLKYI